MNKKVCCTCEVVVLLIKAISKVFFFDSCRRRQSEDCTTEFSVTDGCMEACTNGWL